MKASLSRCLAMNVWRSRCGPGRPRPCASVQALTDLFLCDSPSRCNSRPTDERCTFSPWFVANSAVSSSIVRSGWVAIRFSTQPLTPVSLPQSGLPGGFGESEPVSRSSRTMSLTNLIESQRRCATSVCVLKWSGFLGQFCGLAKMHLVCVHAAFRVSAWPKYAMSGVRLSRAV
jgi:hypothetical protein